jgi:Reverse transcriptase (RNA-dependent DNA polymerase)
MNRSTNKAKIKHRESRPPTLHYPFELEITFCVRGVYSPLLANVYLHYSFDLWVKVWRQKWAQGEVIVIRYADDSIAGFQYQTDADRFLVSLRERLAKFGLELHPDKTRRIEFGRFAEENRKRRGEGKAETSAATSPPRCVDIRSPNAARSGLAANSHTDRVSADHADRIRVGRSRRVPRVRTPTPPCPDDPRTHPSPGKRGLAELVRPGDRKQRSLRPTFALNEAHKKMPSLA